jgi:hypothetical protein
VSRFPQDGFLSEVRRVESFLKDILMPIVSAQTLEDLQREGAERLIVVCDKCDRMGIYAIDSLLAEHGPEQQLPDLLAFLSRNCPNRDQCGAKFQFDVE